MKTEFTCSKSTAEAPELGANTSKANNKDTRTTSLSDVFIAHLKHNPHPAPVLPPPNLNKQLSQMKKKKYRKNSNFGKL